MITVRFEYFGGTIIVSPTALIRSPRELLPQPCHREERVMAEVLGKWLVAFCLRFALHVFRVSALGMIELPNRACSRELRGGVVQRSPQQLTRGIATPVAHASQRGPVGHAVPSWPSPHT